MEDQEDKACDIVLAPGDLSTPASGECPCTIICRMILEEMCGEGRASRRQRGKWRWSSAVSGPDQAQSQRGCLCLGKISNEATVEAQGVESVAELREGERAGGMCHRLLAPLHLCLCPCLQWPESGLVLKMWSLLLPLKSGSRIMAVNRRQPVVCDVSWAHRVVWVERTFKDHLVPTSLPCAGTPLNRPDCSEPCLAWP